MALIWCGCLRGETSDSQIRFCLPCLAAHISISVQPPDSTSSLISRSRGAGPRPCCHGDVSQPRSFSAGTGIQRWRMLRWRGFFLKHPPRARQSCSDHMVRQRSAVLCENSDLWERNSVRTVFQFKRTRGKPKHTSGSLRTQTGRLAVSCSIGSPLSQLLIDFSSCRLITVHVCSRGSGLTRWKNPLADIRATSKIALKTRGLEEEKSREMGLVQLRGRVLSVWGTERWK